MAYNPFLGWSQTDLEKALDAAQTDLAAGKTTVGAGDGQIMVKGQVSMRPETRVELILKALNKLDPDTYPLDEITRVTQTRVVFGTPNPIANSQ